jgi:hypothetical protein
MNLKFATALCLHQVLSGAYASEEDHLHRMAKSSKTGGKSQCSRSGEVWSSCQGYVVGGGPPVKEVRNATKWWYDNIYPYIPEDEKMYYTEPFGGEYVVIIL